ncbi:hypothetical protein F6X42_22495 [Paraburkholderia sp. WC7.3b]|uniref:Uncharacterized protein n=2 Tax=Burkholderiaceae TaxID=119060 RepID=A0ABR7PSP4_9BURK|nr:hypothetical protein [Paraburkholderia podalyriae]
MAEDTKMMDVSSPAMPDVEELRMLRALVYEGVALARHGPYVARFHRWIVQVSREGRCSAGCLAPVTVEIRHPHGALLERTCLVVDDRADRETGR